MDNKQKSPSPPSVKAFDMDNTASLNSISKEMFAPSVKLDEAPHLPDTNVGDIPQQSESQPSVKPEREDDEKWHPQDYSGQNSPPSVQQEDGEVPKDFHSGSKGKDGRTYPIGGFAPGNYMCKCANCGKRFMGDKLAVQCEPCAERASAQPSPTEQEGDDPGLRATIGWIARHEKRPDECEDTYETGFQITAQKVLNIYHKAMEQARRFDEKIASLQSQLSAKEKEIESLVESVESWEGEARRLAAGKQDYIKHLEEMKVEAIQNVNLFKDPDTDDEISELRYWYGKQCAYEEAISKYTPQNPPKNE